MGPAHAWTVGPVREILLENFFHPLHWQPSSSSSLRAGHWQYQHLVIKTLLPTLVISSSSSSDMSSSSLSSAERGFCRFGRFHFPLKSLPVPQLKYQVNQ